MARVEGPELAPPAPLALVRRWLPIKRLRELNFDDGVDASTNVSSEQSGLRGSKSCSHASASKVVAWRHSMLRELKSYGLQSTVDVLCSRWRALC
jgi:hypothetical protein